MKRRLAAALLTVGLAVGVAAIPTGAAFAKITSQCKNPGGNIVQGQCNGQALDLENVNPAGFAPPGQNK
jgi:hypothetical protein